MGTPDGDRDADPKASALATDPLDASEDSSSEIDASAAPLGVPLGTRPAEPPITADEEEAKKMAFWNRMFKAGFFESMEQCRDEHDRPDWREVEAAARLAKEADQQPSRMVPDDLGTYAGRSCRQVNVKLGTPDFAALVSLAIERDLPPSTMARMLLRRAIGEAAGVAASGRARI